MAIQSFNAINKPLQAAILTLLRAFIVYVPLALLGAALWGAQGIFIATLITNLAAGTFGYFYLTGKLKNNAELSIANAVQSMKEIKSDRPG